MPKDATSIESTTSCGGVLIKSEDKVIDDDYDMFKAPRTQEEEENLDITDISENKTPIEYEFDYCVHDDRAHIIDVIPDPEGDLVFPEVIDGYLVTEIRKSSLGAYSKVRTISIPRGVKSIVTGENGVLLENSLLESFFVAENNEEFSSIDGVLFSKDKRTLICYPVGRKQKTYTIPDGVTEIRYGAFLYARWLETIEIPNSVTDIGLIAFAYCRALKKVIIPNIGYADDLFWYNPQEVWNLETDDDWDHNILAEFSRADDLGPNCAFYGCDTLSMIVTRDDNPKFSSVDGVLFSKDLKTLIRYPKGRDEINYVIPESVSSIDFFAFLECRSLESVSIPDSVKNIRESAFRDCKALKNIIIPKEVTEISEALFWGCCSLKNVTIQGEIYCIEHSAFYECTALECVLLPESLKKIEHFAFYGCKSLTDLIIPGKVENIEESAFADCESLTSITILGYRTKVAKNAFEGCNQLEETKTAGEIISGTQNLNARD